MLRITLAFLVALGLSVGGYLFVSPPSLQVARHEAPAIPPSPGGIASAPRSSGPIAESGASPGAPGAAASHALAVRVLQGSDGNPPRRTGHRRVAPAYLRLPKVLPQRTLDVPILMYHHVSYGVRTDSVNYGLTVGDDEFAAQLRYLHAHGYHTILLRQLFSALYGGTRLPAHPIVLTFDDGYLDNYTDALPLLLRAHDVAEFAIISAYPGITLGINRYMSWGQLRRLVAHGMEIGSHTVDHQDLGTLPEEHVRFELRDSRNILQRRLGMPVQFLTYPSGEPFKSGSAAARQLLLTLLPAYGYVGALLDGPLTGARQDAQQPYQLRRIRVAGGETIGDFAASLQR